METELGLGGMVIVAYMGHLALHLCSSIGSVQVSRAEKRQVGAIQGSVLWLQNSVSP